jgi:hypothetical protein
MESSNSSQHGDGWIYCFENPCMSGIYKIGLTTRTPESRLAEANAADTWRPPLPYQLVTAVRVTNVTAVEKAIHQMLESLGARIHPRREFFRLPRTTIDNLFTIIGSGMPNPLKEESDSDTSESDSVIQHITEESGPTKTKARIACICCDWVGINASFPYHAIRYHPESLYLDKKQFDHCANLHLVNGADRIPFTACLVCRKGTVTSPYCGNGARWTTCHSLSTTCKDAHAEMIADLGLGYLPEDTETE